VELLAEVTGTCAGQGMVVSHEADLLLDRSHPALRRSHLGSLTCCGAQCDHGHGHRDERHEAADGGRA
jgi:hypothetical protein